MELKKRTINRKKCSFLGITGFLILSLLFLQDLSFAGDFTPADFAGDWINDDPNTTGMTRLIITNEQNLMSIHGYGKCRPLDCDWGTVTAKFTANPFVAVYQADFKTNTLTIRLIDTNSLHVHSKNVFSDGSNRDYEADYYLHKQKGTSRIDITVKDLTTKRYNFTTTSSGLKIKEITRDQLLYRQLTLPKGKLFGNVGEPGLPGITRLVAVPKNAQVQVTITEGYPQVFENYLIEPKQEIPEDNIDYKTPPFAVNTQFYTKKILYPEKLYSIEYDYIRGCKIAIIHIHLARYNPALKKVLYYPNLDVDINFIGEDETYIPYEKKSRFFEGMYANVIPNYEIARVEISELIYAGPLFKFCDLLIITPSDFKNQADALANWKREKGFLTRVATLDQINTAQGGTTADDIRDYIKNVYNVQNLSYVLLLGDAEFIPTHYVTPHPTAHGGTLMATDLYYAEMDDAGYFPDLAIGRIPVDTAAEAQIVVDKIINYEQNPPADQDFYRTILCAAFFQDDDRDGFAEASDSDGRAQREFAETMEDIRNFFLSEGYPDCPRIYATDSPDPQWWRDGSSIPAAIRMPGFPWGGDADDIIAEINSGTFLVAHRDHGGRTGWGDPDFHTSDLTDLTNNELLPVVLSINCQTGWFDNETDDAVLGTLNNSESFAEELLIMGGGGAVAVIAATRNSPSYPNNDLTEGFIDCIWNDMLPGYPSAGEVGASGIEGSVRIGDALNYAKFYVASERDGVSACQRPFEIYHVLGDPTMEIWTSNPNMFTYIPWDPIEIYRYEYQFPIPPDPRYEGIIVSLIQDGKIIAQGMPKDGMVTIKLDQPLAYSDDTKISIIKDGYAAMIQPVGFSFSTDITTCPVSLPDPVPGFVGMEPYDGGIRYLLTVKNRTDYPDGLFAAASNLPPCGLNTNSSRTWVRIENQDGGQIYGFCALGSSDNLNSIWFGVPDGTDPPESVRIILNDRYCEHEYASDLLPVPDLASPPASDLEIRSTWADVSPVIDGIVSDGEWNDAGDIPLYDTIGIERGTIYIKNDNTAFYILLDITGDTEAGPEPDDDYAGIAFDIDLDGFKVPYVDSKYTTAGGTENFGIQQVLSESGWTGVQPVSSLYHEGFGSTLSSAVPHKFYEYKLLFDEIDINYEEILANMEQLFHARISVKVESSTPDFTIYYPSNYYESWQNAMILVALDLGTFTVGSDEPVIAGIGLIPRTFINQGTGLATTGTGHQINVTDAPFGKHLRVIGNIDKLRDAGINYYAIGYTNLDSHPGNGLNSGSFDWSEWRFVEDARTNYYWNSAQGRYVLESVSPQIIHDDGTLIIKAYPVPSGASIWYLPNLLFDWRTTGTVRVGSGLYKLHLFGFTSAGLASIVNLFPDAEASMAVRIDNTYPVMRINSITYNGTEIDACGVVQLEDSTDSLTINVSAYDPDIHLRNFTLYALYGDNQSFTCHAESYDGTPLYDGAMPNADFVCNGDAGDHWETTCGYTFRVSGWDRAINGYGKIHYNAGHKTITILMPGFSTGLCDINGDGVIGLVEAIYILQGLSGNRP